MTKREYLDLLHRYLAPLPEEERNELLRDYETHFTFGVQSGKSEHEIARELGDPMTIAREVVGPDYVPLPPTPPAHRDIPRTIGVSIVLFFLNIAVVPIGVSLWAVFVSISAFAAGAILSPVSLLAETTLYGGYESYKLYTMLGMTGIGILLATVIPSLWRWWLRGTIGYALWTAKTWKGRV